MGEKRKTSGPQFRADRPREQEAVRTTIVGGRPPGRGKPLGDIPVGLEVLLKKAAVDPQFKATLLSDRAAAADQIDLKLDQSEALMLAAVPAEQLEQIIGRTTVPDEQRRVFLGHAAAAMLAVVGLGIVGCGPMDAPRGAAPDIPPAARERPERIQAGETGGSQPDVPPDPGPAKRERPEQLPAPTGSAPDIPPEAPGAAPPPQ